MQLEQQFDLPLPPAGVWPAFGDVALLVGCLPGAALAGDEADGQWPLRFDIRLGPVAASFGGQGRLVRDDVTHSGHFEGQASDRKTGSRVKGAAAFSLAPQGDGTRVSVSIDYTLTGALAQVGRGGIVKELAGALTAQFADNLRQRLAATVPATMPAADAALPPMEAAALGDMAPLSVGALLWQALLRWLSRWWPKRRSEP